MNRGAARQLRELRNLQLVVESLHRSSSSRNLIREQDEADVRRFNFEPTEIQALNGRMIWEILAELRDEGQLRDALKNSWGDDRNERARAAHSYIWDRVFDGGRKGVERWVVYLPPDKFTYKGVTLKDLRVKELRVEVALAARSGTIVNPGPVPKAYWWSEFFAASYQVIGLLPSNRYGRYAEMWLGELKLSPNYEFGAIGSEAAINGVNFYFSDKGKKALDENLKEFEHDERIRKISQSRNSEGEAAPLDEAEKKSSKSSSKSSSSKSPTKKQEPLPPIPTTTEFEREMRGIISAYHAGEDIEAWLTQDIAGSSVSAHGLSRKSGWTGDDDFYRKPSASYIAQHLAAKRDPELRAIGQRVLRKLEKLAGHRRFMSLGGGFGLDPVDDDWDE
jgi:hypothetical protein